MCWLLASIINFHFFVHTMIFPPPISLEWLLILLASLSVTLVIFVFIVSYYVLKHWCRTHKYDKIRPPKNSRYVPGKTAAYFKGNHEAYYSFLPVTHPTTIQSNTPLVRASFKHRSGPSSIASQNASQYGRQKVSTFERKHHHTQQTDLNRCISMDDRLFRRSLAYDKTDSPPEESIASSRRDSFNDASSIYIENTPDRSQSAYVHAHLMNDSEATDVMSEPVVSYDQEHYSIGRIESPGMLSFTLEYIASVPELLITVKNGIDLPSATGNTEGRVNSYVNLCIVPEDFLWKRTRVVENDRDPVYAETFQIRDVLYHKLREYTLCFYVMDCHPVMGERVIGKILYPLSDLRAEQLVDVCKGLSPP